MTDDGFVGLGFHHPGPYQADPPKSTSVADALMKQYMQQCLEYHHQQEEEVKPEFEPSQPLQQEVFQQQQQQQQEASMFVPAQQPRIATNYANMRATDQAKVEQQQQQQQWQAVENARAIAMKFHAQHHQGTAVVSHPIAASDAPPAQVDVLPAIISMPHPTPSEYAAKRARHAEIERKRLHRALIKNFEYVARKDEEDMKRQAEELEWQKALSANIALRSEQTFDRRREAVLAAQQLQQQRQEEKAAGSRHKVATSMSGIGTSSRKRLEQKKRKEGHVAGSSGQKDLSSAVYITGLPVDGSFKEEGLRQLFGCYGTIRRVTQYTDKSTGRLKGDGLVVFDNPQNLTAAGEILDAVCTQLNGAELPCGSKITVEPADADYKSKVKKDPGADTGAGDREVGYYGPAAAETAGENEAPSFQAVATSTHETGKKNEDAGDDLDDFFASLT